MSFLSGCPVGVVFAYAGPTAPDGWLLCDGNTVNRTTYAALFAAIGVAHGNGNGTTTFHLPDYRGRMLRGRDGGAGRDPDRAARTTANTGGNTGDNVGSVQGQATAKNGMTVTNGSSAITGGLTMNSSSISGTAAAQAWSGSVSGGNSASNTNLVTSFNQGQSAANGAATAAATNGTLISAAAQAWSGSVFGGNSSSSISGTATAQTLNSHTFVTTANVTLNNGDAETRPINAYVNYIIKI